MQQHGYYIFSNIVANSLPTNTTLTQRGWRHTISISESSHVAYQIKRH